MGIFDIGITGQQDYFEIAFTEYAWAAFEGVIEFSPQELP